MNGLLVAQSLEIGPERVGAEEFRIARMKFTKRRSKGFCASGAQHFIPGLVPNSVHVDIAAANSRFKGTLGMLIGANAECADPHRPVAGSAITTREAEKRSAGTRIAQG